MTATDELKGIIRKYAIKNAIDYGRADPGSVLGKVIMNAKGIPIPAVKALVDTEVGKVNKMRKAELEKEYAEFAEEFAQAAKDTAEKTAKPKMELPGAVKGNFATRYPPAPNGYMHIGHAKAAILEQEFAKIYDGKLFLYFDDTNPEKDAQEYVDKMKEDLDWLGIKFDKEYYASDSIKEVYKCIEQLLKQDNAYVCNCSQEEIKKKRFDKVPCTHRKRKTEENIKLFKKMLKGELKDGEAVVRLKGDMSSQNTVMRDPTLLRIKNHKHYRQGEKYSVWPTYDINTPVNDSIHGVTDVIRSKEFELRDPLGTMILKMLKMRTPRIHSIARLVIKDNVTHKSELNKLIKAGTINGWDDPRLVTISALRRRGIQPNAIRELALRSGMSKTDATVPIDMLMAENKKIIDPTAKHLFFVGNPVKMTVKETKEKHAKLRLHPSNEHDHREYNVGNVFYIGEDDAKQLKKGDLVRLKDLTDVKVTKTGAGITAEEVEKLGTAKVIQWVSDKNFAKCSILVPGSLLDAKGNYNHESLKEINGYVESHAEKLKEHEIVQFERFGYCILDDKKIMQFIFISK